MSNRLCTPGSRDQIVTKNRVDSYCMAPSAATNSSGAPLGLLRTSGGTP